MPKIGWAGVFGIAIAFGLTATVLAFVVLRRMKVPVARGGRPRAAADGGSGVQGVADGAGGAWLSR